MSTDGTQGDGPSVGPALSDNGRFLAFTSQAANLVANDTNAAGDVFLRDHQAKTTVRVSVADNEAQANSASGAASVSDDGRLIAFVSSASNLVQGDTNGLPDVFVRDVVSGTTRRVSTLGGQGARISGNGRHVVYVVAVEAAPNVVLQSVVSTDLVSGTSTTVASTSIQPPIEPATFSSLSISDDGAYLVYRSSAYHSGLRVTFIGLVLWTRATNSYQAISGASSPATMDGGELSGAGRFVAFSSQLDAVPEQDVCDPEVGSSTLPPGCDSDVFVWDRVTGAFEAVSAQTQNGALPGEHHVSSISDDGRLVLFETNSGGKSRLHVRDRTAATTSLASPQVIDVHGVITGDGRLVALASDDPLVDGDSNGVSDVFVRRTVEPSVTAVAPGPLHRGAPAVEVVITGTAFDQGSGISVSGAGVTVSNVRYVNPTTLRATVVVAANAATGLRDVTVVDPALFPASDVGVAAGVCSHCLTVN